MFKSGGESKEHLRRERADGIAHTMMGE